VVGREGGEGKKKEGRKKNRSWVRFLNIFKEENLWGEFEGGGGVRDVGGEREIEKAHRDGG
jgi:hypothetical protein